MGTNRFRALVLMSVLAVFTSCSSSSSSLDGMPVERAAGVGQPPAPKLTVLRDTAGPKTAYRRPIISETRVLAVWVPEHVDEEADVKVSGHWVYFRLNDAQWVVDGQSFSSSSEDEPHPRLTNTAEPNPDLGRTLKRPFQDRAWIVPYRAPEQEGRKERRDEN